MHSLNRQWQTRIFTLYCCKFTIKFIYSNLSSKRQYISRKIPLIFLITQSCEHAKVFSKENMSCKETSAAIRYRLCVYLLKLGHTINITPPVPLFALTCHKHQAGSVMWMNPFFLLDRFRSNLLPFRATLRTVFGDPTRGALMVCCYVDY